MHILPRGTRDVKSVEKDVVESINEAETCEESQGIFTICKNMNLSHLNIKRMSCKLS